jgi:hypothetical protein
MGAVREKGGKSHAMPCHHNLETYLSAYIEGAGLAGDPKRPLFRTIGRGTVVVGVSLLEIATHDVRSHGHFRHFRPIHTR